MPGAPDGLRLIAPDMRGFGDTERVPIDATRGLRDWADDTAALLRALGIERPVHLAGWSTGGAAIAAFAADRPVASLTLHRPGLALRLRRRAARRHAVLRRLRRLRRRHGQPGLHRSASPRATARRDVPASPRNVMNASYWAPTHREPPEREEILLDEILKSRDRRRRLPGRLVAVARTGRRSPPARAGSSTRCRRSTATGRASSSSTPSRRSCGRTAPRTSSSPTASAWEIGTLGQAGRGARLAGRGGVPAAADGHARSATSSSATATPAATSSWRCSRARATSRRSTRGSAGRALFFGFVADAER